VLGHAWQRTPADSLNYRADLEDADTRVLEGNTIVDDYFSATFKPTERIIMQQQSFFHGLRSVRQILVMGHSLSKVDAPYLEEIIKHIDSTAVTWRVSYHGNPAKAQARMSELKIDPSLISFARFVDF
jgi:hypothetical protein